MSSGLARPPLTASNLSNVEVRQSEIHDLLEDMKKEGIEKDIELPQVAVFGDQSSAKSSVLEAYSGIQLPTKDVLCTRFPIELRMKKTTVNDFKVSITPWPQASQAEKARLKAWTIEDRIPRPRLTDLPQIVDLAADFMGLRRVEDEEEEEADEAATGQTPGTHQTGVDSETDSGDPPRRRQLARLMFSRHALCIEISGPAMPNLSLVDLPGLFHAEGGGQTLQDARHVEELAVDYMSRSRTIILAIVQATVDPASQIVTTLASRHDRGRSRTFGIITKPDTLQDAPNLQKIYVKVLKNQYMPVALGFHVVRTRKPSERDLSPSELAEVERKLFSSSPWKELPSEVMGTPNLKVQLDRIICNHITDLAAPLAEEVEQLIGQESQRLQKLISASSQVITAERLAEVGTELQKLLELAINGQYQGDFFRGRGSESSVFLRPSIERLVQQFVKSINQRGHTYTLTSCAESQPRPTSSAANVGSTQFPGPIVISYADYLSAVVAKLKTNHTVPGQLDYNAFWELFQEQAKGWIPLLEQLVAGVTQQVRQCVQLMAQELCDGSQGEVVFNDVVLPTLQAHFTRLEEKVLEDTLDIRERTALKSLASEVTDEIAVTRRQEWKRTLKQNLPGSIEELSASCRGSSRNILNVVNAGPTQDLVEAVADRLSCLLAIEDCTGAEMIACLTKYYKSRMSDIVHEYSLYNVTRWMSQLKSVLPDAFHEHSQPGRLSLLNYRDGGAVEEQVNLERRIHNLKQITQRLQALHPVTNPKQMSSVLTDPLSKPCPTLQGRPKRRLPDEDSNIYTTVKVQEENSKNKRKKN